MSLSRRSLLGFIAAAPVIIRATSLMPVRSFLGGPIIGDGVVLMSAPHPAGSLLLMMTGYDELGELVTEEIEIVRGAPKRSLRWYRAVNSITTA